MFPHLVTRPDVVLPCHVDPTGRTGPTPGQARGPGRRRVAPGWSVPSGVDGGALDQRIVEALAGLPADAAVTGWAALGWRGGRWFGGLAADGRTRLDVPVALTTRGPRPRVGVELTEDWLFEADVDVVDGLPVTRTERAVAFESCRASGVAAAVRVVDMACADDLTDLARLRRYAAGLVSRPGVRTLRAALDLADENAWSPQEVGMRLSWQRRRPTAVLRTNCPLFDPASPTGRHLVTPDLVDLRAGVVGEYDGVVHLGDRLRRKDLDRDALYRELDLELVTMASGDRRDVSAFVNRLDAAYRRAAQRPDRPPRWTTAQPGWWVDTSTVARRRALDERQRRIWLRRAAR
ncbi:hypothetical protein [Nocardioides nitrophenolicus]|uniref:hypothetical protein n=1 Tax=Nocardioides nitrophenolicus TaxID=60489 RepID=UPI001EF7DFE0|nr:hypothetical protein [Nocardioides nitrophenolicus]MBM7518963.1 hypothetical protein [Nocardioides nitrophenolicus]